MSLNSPLAGSKRAAWSESALDTLRGLLDGTEAQARAGRMRRMETTAPIPSDLAARYGLQSLSSGAVLCDAGRAHDLARELAARGVAAVAISPVEHVFADDNAVFSDFVKTLSQTA